MNRILRRAQRGYNLVEVLIAMALVGVVTLSILTLFSLARGNVYSGKEATQALALGTHAMEDMSNLTLQGVYDSFDIKGSSSPAPALGNYTIDGVQYQNVMIRSTDPQILCCEAGVTQTAPNDLSHETTPTGGTGLLTTWTNQLAQNHGLQRGSITIIMAPRIPQTPILNSSGMANNQLIRIRVIVRWKEALRKRSIILDSAKTQRSATTTT